ncbi:hypothetical protein HPB48_025813 [Haemaphysalis longicornis]|uniref:Lysosome-associated membrane glycoprotein 5 n=1 Tax=Haemaphysalis longicornis TaxID=44386 RepID=A0A9J6H8A1_HAELO|nr:hypothetical protein HPB48_025813 [Haemaphysalis longicornis]
MKWTASFALVAYLAIVSGTTVRSPFCAANGYFRCASNSRVNSARLHRAAEDNSGFFSRDYNCTPCQQQRQHAPQFEHVQLYNGAPGIVVHHHAQAQPDDASSPGPSGPKEPSVNSYNVTEPGTNHTCILMMASLQLKYDYHTTDNKTLVGVLPLDNETMVDVARSSCGMGHGENQTQTLALRFYRNYTLTLVFFKNATVYLGDVTAHFNMDPVHFPNASQPRQEITVRNNTLMMYSVPEGRSYHCAADQAVYIGAGLTLDVISVPDAGLHQRHHPATWTVRSRCVRGSESCGSVCPSAKAPFKGKCLN